MDAQQQLYKARSGTSLLLPIHTQHTPGNSPVTGLPRDLTDIRLHCGRMKDVLIFAPGSWHRAPKALGISGGLRMSFLKFFINLFTFGCAGSSLLHVGFAASEGYASSHWVGFSLWWLLSLRSTGFWVHGLSCSAARGVFPDQRLNLCPLCVPVGKSVRVSFVY